MKDLLFRRRERKSRSFTSFRMTPFPYRREYRSYRVLCRNTYRDTLCTMPLAFNPASAFAK